MPRLYVARPCVQGLNGIVATIAPVRPVTSHINMTCGRDPGCRCQVMIRKAQGHVMLSEQVEHTVVVPGRMPELERILATRWQSSAIGLEIRWQLEQHGSSLDPRIFSRDSISAIEFAQLSFNRF